MAKNRLTRGTGLAGAFQASGVTGATAASRYVGATTTGAPLTGTFAVGDFVITQDGNIYICTVAGTPGTWAAGINGPGGAVTTLAVSAAATLAGPLILTPAVVAVLAVDVTAGAVQTKSIATASTFTASTGGTAGQLLILVVTVDSTQRVVTFGTNFNSSGTLTIPASKIGTCSFVSDGTAFREIGRAILT